jgi:murein DD-endopeptidase MepM/ murein hydrolase activator NlpD
MFDSLPFVAPLDNPLVGEGWWSNRGTAKNFKAHEGLDYVANQNKVYAIAPGIVTYSGYVTDGGNMIVIEHDQPPFTGFISRYIHLKTRKVRRGTRAKPTRVEAGQLIGISGKTGKISTGPHLHLDISITKPLIEMWKSTLGKSGIGRQPGATLTLAHLVPTELFAPWSARDATAGGVKGAFALPARTNLSAYENATDVESGPDMSPSMFESGPVDPIGMTALQIGGLLAGGGLIAAGAVVAIAKR